jgi:anti-sigma-K factor RskA
MMADERPIQIEDELDDAALEALAEAHATPPPPALRERVLAAAARESRSGRAEAGVRRWRLVGAVAAALALALGSLWQRDSGRLDARTRQLQELARANAELEGRVDEQARLLANLHEGMAAQAEVLRIVGSAERLSATLAPQASHKGAGQVVVEPSSGAAALVLTGVPPAAPGKTYELWTIRGERAPEPAGLVEVGPDGTVARRLDTIANPREVTAFAVSIEPAGGSPSPTGPIVLVGPVRS